MIVRPAKPHSQKHCFTIVVLLVVSAHLLLAFAEAWNEIGQCAFENDPLDVGSFWDPECEMGTLGCYADGRNVQCRLCGAGAFISVPCPASSCKFPTDPFVSYYWDTDCEEGRLGCLADGIHAQCRFCGDSPFTNVTCPEGTPPPNVAACAFESEPETPYYWEAECALGENGCNADGLNVRCRWCGEGNFSDIPCPVEQVCQFAQTPTLPYFWDPDCKEGLLGCNADGVHQECRFCAARPFEDVPCPDDVAAPATVELPEQGCTWPRHAEPQVPYFWDVECKEGMLGCWADGIHAECRFCGSGAYRQVACLDTTTERPSYVPAGSLQYDVPAIPARLAYDVQNVSQTAVRAYDWFGLNTTGSEWEADDGWSVSIAADLRLAAWPVYAVLTIAWSA